MWVHECICTSDFTCGGPNLTMDIFLGGLLLVVTETGCLTESELTTELVWIVKPAPEISWCLCLLSARTTGGCHAFGFYVCPGT